MSSSRRSPAVATTPIREIFPRSVWPGLHGGVALEELAEHAHPGGVVAVVDDDVDVVHVDLVHPAGGEVVRRRERAQALADLVQAGAAREGRTRGRHRVGDVEQRRAAERRGSRWVHASCIDRRPCRMTIMSPRSVRSSTTARPPRRQWSSMKSRTALPGLGQAEPDDRARAAAPHPAHERVVGVEHGEPVARHRLDDDGLDVGELLEGVDAAHAEVVGRDVGDDGDVVAVVAQALAQDAAAGHLHDREVDARVLQHHPGRARAGRVGAHDEALVDDDAVGRGHPDLAAQALHDVGDHPRRRRLAVRAGHGDDRHARRRAGREEQVDDGLGDVLRLTDRRVGVHPEPGRGVDLADRAAGLAHGGGDVGADEVDAGDVEADEPGGLLGDLDVVGVGVERAVDRDAAGRHVAGERQLDHRVGGRHVVEAEALLAQQLLARPRRP